MLSQPKVMMPSGKVVPAWVTWNLKENLRIPAKKNKRFKIKITDNN